MINSEKNARPTHDAHFAQTRPTVLPLPGGEGGRSPKIAFDSANAPGEITLLPVFGDAAAAWTPDGTPVLFQPGGSNHFVLRNATNGEVLRAFPLAGEPKQGNEDHPVLALTPDGRLAAASVILGRGRGAEPEIAAVPPLPCGRAGAPI